MKDNIFFMISTLIIVCLIIILFFIVINQKQYCLFGRCPNSMLCRIPFQSCNVSKEYRGWRYPWLKKNPLFQDS